MQAREREHEFLEIFRRESNERLDDVVETLSAIRAGRAGPEASETLFREIHTIKGAAGMLELVDVHAISHAVEQALVRVRARPQFPVELVDPLLAAISELRRHVVGHGGPYAEVLARLDEAAPG